MQTCTAETAAGDLSKRHEDNTITPEPIRVLLVDGDRERADRLRAAVHGTASFPITIRHSGTTEEAPWGGRTSIDDFGTGFSSLAELRRFPISKLKIDQSFIKMIPDDSRTAAITRAIIDMAHCLDMRTVAEGVERTDQLEFLEQNGCDEAQGYLFARPVAAPEAHDLLRAWPMLHCES